MRKVIMLSSLLLLASLVYMVQNRAVADESSGPGGVAVGAKAPDFTLQNQDGSPVSLHDFSGKIVVLEWVNPHCPFVKRHYEAHTMTTLASDFKNKGVVWLSINSTKGTTNDSDKQWAVDQSLDYPVLNDVDTTTGKAYHATNTPEMYIVGKDGTLLYKGAIDNDSSPDGSMTTGKINYVRQALDEITAGKPVSVPETKAYGCSVHYRD